MRKLLLPYFTFYENSVLWLGAFLKLLISRIPGYRRIYEVKKTIDNLQNHYTFNRNGSCFYISNNGKDPDLIYQVRTKGSDLMVFNQVIVAEEYKFLKNNIRKHTEVKTIIDAGANIGISSMYLSNIFPKSTIYAIEPEFKNYQMLLRNIEMNRLRNVQPINAALWKENIEMTLKADFRDKLNWSFQTIPAGKGTKKFVRGVTLDTFIAEHNIRKIDILKMDIEGAEDQIFKNYPLLNEILFITDVIAIEIHDEVSDRLSIITQLKNNKFSVFESGETTYAFKQ